MEYYVSDSVLALENPLRRCSMNELWGPSWPVSVAQAAQRHMMRDSLVFSWPLLSPSRQNNAYLSHCALVCWFVCGLQWNLAQRMRDIGCHCARCVVCLLEKTKATVYMV